MKGKLYRTVVRTALMYCFMTVARRKRQEAEMELAELKMVSFLCWECPGWKKIRIDYVRGTAGVERFGDNVRAVRLRWFGNVQRRNIRYTGKRVLNMELLGRRKRKRRKRKFMDLAEEDMKRVTVTEENARGRVRWRQMIHSGNPQEEQAQRRSPHHSRLLPKCYAAPRQGSGVDFPASIH